jgi:hypothetical protein
MHLASADSEARALILWHGGPFGAMSVKNRSVYRAVQALKVIITQILCLLYAGLTPTFLSEPSNISMYPQQLFLKIIVVFWWQSDPAIILHFLVKKHHIESWAKKYSTFYIIIILSGQWKRIHLDTKYLRCWRDSIIYEQERARVLHDYLLSASPLGYSPLGYSPLGYSPLGYSPLGYSPLGYSPLGYSPLYSFSDPHAFVYAHAGLFFAA